MKNYLVCILVFLFSIGNTFAAMTLSLDAEFLSSQGIITPVGDTGDYRLGDFITRRETMKIVMNMSGKPVGTTCDSIFSDVKPADWGCKYVESALKEGFITKNPSFRPDDNISKTEFMKLALKAKGIKKIQETSNWAEDYMETAYYFGIIDTKYYDYHEPANREWVFKIATSTIKEEENIMKQGGIISDEAL